MKDRKHMTHNELVNEITRQLTSRFHPDPLFIKKRIENLIDVSFTSRGLHVTDRNLSENIWNDVKIANRIITWSVGTPASF